MRMLAATALLYCAVPSLDGYNTGTAACNKCSRNGSFFPWLTLEARKSKLHQQNNPSIHLLLLYWSVFLEDFLWIPGFILIRCGKTCKGHGSHCYCCKKAVYFGLFLLNSPICCTRGQPSSTLWSLIRSLAQNPQWAFQELQSLSICFFFFMIIEILGSKKCRHAVSIV